MSSFRYHKVANNRLGHMKSCYPLLSEEKPESIRDVWTNMLYQLRTDSLVS